MSYKTSVFLGDLVRWIIYLPLAYLISSLIVAMILLGYLGFYLMLVYLEGWSFFLKGLVFMVTIGVLGRVSSILKSH